MDVCLIPAWRRPEMLWHTLENIKRADGAADLHYIFRFDQGHTEELYQVVKGFPFSHEVSVTPRSRYRLTKQSFSLLTGYHAAAQKSTGLVFMIEEDVMVATDFFRYHRVAHELHPELFCSIAVANPNRHVVDVGAHNDYYLSMADYCSLGVCFRRETIMEDILPWATVQYYINPIDYCRRTFPRSPIGDAFAEQDGLLRRIQWLLGAERPIAYPYQPKAYHAGLYGKNRGAGPSGPLAERLRYVTEVIYSDEAMRKFARHKEWYEDSKPINLNAQPWLLLNLRALPLDRNPLKV